MKAGWRIRRLRTGQTLMRRRTGRAFVPVGPDGEIRVIASGLRIGAGVALGNGLLNLAHQSPVWLVGGTCAWCWAAWRAGGPARPSKQAETDTVAPWSGEEIQAYLEQLLPDLIGDRNGVHLDTVLTAAQQTAALPAEATVADLRRDLEARGYTVRSSLKVGGHVRVGIHRDDLPTVEQPLPDRAEALAG